MKVSVDCYEVFSNESVCSDRRILVISKFKLRGNSLSDTGLPEVSGYQGGYTA